MISWLWVAITLIVALVTGAVGGVFDAVPPPPPPPETPVEAFIRGYQDGGGDPAHEGRLIGVIQCESKWAPDPPGYHYGLAQFAPGTWHSAKCSPGADYTNPWDQGCAMGRWTSMIAPRWGTTVGWPVCWWVGG